MQIALFGATGLVGRALALRLRRDGHTVRVWARDPVRARGLLGAEVEIVAAGAGRNGRTIIELPAGTRGRYVMIKNIGTRPDGWWTISELLVD